jgi:hypothetical protein
VISACRTGVGFTSAPLTRTIAAGSTLTTAFGPSGSSSMTTVSRGVSAVRRWVLGL